MAVQPTFISSSNVNMLQFNTLENCKPCEYSILEEKDLIKYVKKVERIVRTSYEYRKYLNYLRNELDLTKCSFFSKIDTSVIKKVYIEFHHYPFTLFDIVLVIVRKYIELHGVFVPSPLKVANDVIKLHFKNHVGLVPLSVTVHQLAHAGEIFIPLTMVHGNVKKFIKKYKEYFTDELLEKLKVLKKVTIESPDLNILKRNLRFISIENREKLTKIEAINPMYLEENKIAC
jgi:hypothetical protein